jgi:hypothetical protein
MKFLKGTVVKHPKVDWGKGVVLEDTSGPTIKIRFEKVGLKTLSLAHIQPIPLDEPMVAETEIARLEQMGRVYIDETFKDIYDDIKSRYPDHIVVIQNGYYFEVLEADAEYFSREYGWKLYERQAGVTITGFPDQVEKAWRDLRAKNTPYILVSQLDLREGGKVQRTISEIFPDQA